MEQYRAAVPESQRVNGWLYDANSGVLMGIGSHEQREKHGYNAVFVENRAGCPHKMLIHWSNARDAEIHGRSGCLLANDHNGKCDYGP